MRIVTLDSEKEVEVKNVAQIGMLDNPLPRHRKVMPRDEVKMDSLWETGASLKDIKGIVDLNPGCQLYVHIAVNSTGFWLPVLLKD